MKKKTPLSVFFFSWPLLTIKLGIFLRFLTENHPPSDVTAIYIYICTYIHTYIHCNFLRVLALLAPLVCPRDFSDVSDRVSPRTKNHLSRKRKKKPKDGTGVLGKMFGQIFLFLQKSLGEAEGGNCAKKWPPR